MCGGEKKRKKEGNAVRMWRRKKEGKKEGNTIVIFSQYFHNKF